MLQHAYRYADAILDRLTRIVALLEQLVADRERDRAGR
jgi:hypothetical protein